MNTHWRKNATYKKYLIILTGLGCSGSRKTTRKICSTATWSFCSSNCVNIVITHLVSFIVHRKNFAIKGKKSKQNSCNQDLHGQTTMGQEHVHPFDWWSSKHQEYILKVALKIQTQNQGFGNCLMQIMIQKWK